MASASLRPRHDRSQPAVDLEAPGAGWANGRGWTKALCVSDELPEWYSGSPHIKSGYRVGYDACACAGSVFEAHNETMNVWTHLVGGVFFGAETARRLAALAAFGFSLRGGFGGATAADEGTVVVFTVGAMFMLSASALYHTFHPVSETAARRWLMVDKCGIAVMIAASFVPGVWLGLRCSGDVVRGAWLLASGLVLAIGLALGLELVDEKRHTPAFAALVLFGAAPTAHFCLATPPHVLALFIPRLLLMFALYGCGFAFYLSRWPESMFPGRVDLLGASHQLWHVCVLGAALAWYSDITKYIALLESEADVVRCDFRPPPS